MSYEITGTLIEIFTENQVSERFKKREFVIETNENNFVEQIKFQLVQDKTNLIDSFKTGEVITISFNIRGSKWKDTYFVNLQAWKIENAKTGTANEHMPPPPPPPLDQIPPETEDGDDLPF